MSARCSDLSRPNRSRSSESASSATPQDEDDTVVEEALTLPTELKVVVAVEEAVLESCPVGIGDPLTQDWALEAVTEPPEPLPVE